MWPLPCRHKRQESLFRLNSGWKIHYGQLCLDCGKELPTGTEPKEAELLQKYSDAYQFVIKVKDKDIVSKLFWKYYKFMYGGRRAEVTCFIRDTLHI